MTTLTKSILSFNPAMMDIDEAIKRKDSLKIEIQESEKILKLAQCHPDIIMSTPQLFFIKCNKLLQQQLKKLSEKEKKIKHLPIKPQDSDINEIFDEEDRLLNTKNDQSTFLGDMNTKDCTDTDQESNYDSKLETLENKFKSIYSIYEDMSFLSKDQSSKL